MENSVISENGDTKVVPEELRQFGEDRGMPISQENGQRCYGPPVDWTGPPPRKGSEVFVGKLPRDVAEPDLVPIFEQKGRIYEIRLMMDFSGSNRGYCFVQFSTPEEAQKAIRELNNYEICKGRKIGVLKSVDNCRLFIGGLPKEKTEAEIYQEITKVTEGVRKVIAYPSAQDKTKNRGFAFVEYDSHKTAAMARRMMIPGRVTLWGQEVCVDWAEPEPEVKNLYVRNLMLGTSEDTLRELFNAHSNNGVEKVKKIKDYAFIHFASREQAEASRIALDKSDIEGATIEISWAKPVDKGSPRMKSPKQRGNGGSPNFLTSGPQIGQSRGRRPFKQVPQGLPPHVVYSPQDLTNPYMYYSYSYIPNVVPISTLSTSKYPQSLVPVEVLSRLCTAYGWPDPQYDTVAIPHGANTLYSCRVYIPDVNGNGHRLFSSGIENQLFASPEIAKSAAAECLLPRLQQEIYNNNNVPRAPATMQFYMPPAVAHNTTPYVN